jgi:O-antigen/teichoic acid export membrane protein
MKLGQTSIIVFLSKVFGSLLGFIATVYFARILGAEVLGIYSVIIALLGWLKMGGRVGINSAMIKRISEGKQQGEYFTAGGLLIGGMIVLVVGLVLIFQFQIESYVSGFEDYSSASVVWFIVAIFLTFNFNMLVKIALKGQRLVYIAGILNPLKIGIQSIVQILLVYAGYRLVGMLIGYGVGIIVAACIGAVFVSIQPKLPRRRHFRSLLEYAKYSWLSGLKSRAYNDVDILILGVFVSQSLIGIYTVAWSITRFLDVFGIAISQTMFPEISNVSAQESNEAAVSLIEDALTYAGFIIIPGLVGGILLGDRLLQIYSSEFVQGIDVLWLLLLSLLFYAYLKQFLNALNAIDRPDLAFRANIVFIGCNIVLNLILIWQIGWVGAAIASALSAAGGLITAYGLIQRVVDVRVPANEIGRQFAAALTMGGVVWLLRTAIERTEITDHNFVIVLSLVFVGAAVYGAMLLGISPNFRTTISRNLPFDVP